MSAARPAPSLEGTQVKQVACGGMHTAVLAETGTVFTTGVNDEGALGRKTGGAAWEAEEKAGRGTSGSSGDQYSWAPVQFPEEAGTIVQLSAGDSHTVALDDEGQVFAWGTFRSDTGVFGFSPTTRIAVLPTLVLEPTKTAEQVIKICSGTDHVLALRRDGTVMSWGAGFMGQLGRVGSRMTQRKAKATQLQPAPLSLGRARTKAAHIVDLGAGNYSSFAVTAQGHVWAWGLNNYGQLGFSTEKMEPVLSPQLVSAFEGHDVVEVQGGEHHTLARTKDGKILSCGRATYGRLGRTGEGVDPHGDAGCPEPGLVQGLDDAPVHSVSGGGAVSGCVAGEPPRAYFWGFGTTNQLGKGADDDGDELLPLKLRETVKLQHRSILQVAIGGQHAALIAGPQQH
ncbi:hypothetical protein WJX73_000352 [Symbiochloris irregularis]|uniref:RCC1-like domain-containing protein n=1 Tax=Symbiochloris irregularis TaxID=706552 RepID=A0AAW1PVH3_9CHLO